MYNLKNQVAVVTGAASGIGLFVSKRLIDQGARVVLLDLEGELLAENFAGDHYSARPIPTDISDFPTVEETINLVKKEMGRIDILINCAGVTGKTNVHSHDVSVEDIHRVFEINFMGSFYTAKVVLPVMLQQQYGRILHIASIAGKEGNAGMLAYSASKAAVIGMTKVQGKEYAGTGITINAVAPAVIKTSLVDHLPEEQVKYMTDKIPMKRCGTLKELADLISYVISPENSFITGFTFDLTGGRATY